LTSCEKFLGGQKPQFKTTLGQDSARNKPCAEYVFLTFFLSLDFYVRVGFVGFTVVQVFKKLFVVVPLCAVVLT